MVIFYSYVKLPEGIAHSVCFCARVNIQKDVENPWEEPRKMIYVYGLSSHIYLKIYPGVACKHAYVQINTYVCL